MTGPAASAAYRSRLRGAGLCPHCGKPCEPYRECLERRNYKAALKRDKSKFHRTASEKMKAPRGPRRLWTEQDDAVLLEMFQGKKPFKSICLKLDRPPFGVYGRLRRLGIKMPYRTIALIALVSTVET